MGRGVERSGDRLDRRLVERAALHSKTQSQFEIFHGAHERRRNRSKLLPRRRSAREQFVGRAAIAGEERLALRCDAVAFAAASLGLDGRIAHIVEPGERRIDHARARTIPPVKPIFDSLNEFIAMAWLLGDHRKQKQTQLAIIEKPAARAAASMSSAVAFAEIAVSRAVRTF